MIVPDIELSNLSDEEFLIYRAKEYNKISASAARSWLITAQELYPKNFRVQFEVYLIEKSAKNVKEAAKCLGSIIKDFQLAQDALLFKEVDSIMQAVQDSSSLFKNSHLDSSSINLKNDNSTVNYAEKAFLTQLFHALPKCIQQGLIISAADRCTDTMSHCSLLLLLTTLFPETAPQQAHSLVDTLLSAEKMSLSPLNPYRKKLVCSVLPVLVSGDSCSPQFLLHLMSLAIEYYSALLFTASPSPKCASTSRAGAAGSPDSPVNEGWQGLYTVLRELGSKLGWSLAEHFTADTNREMMVQRVQAVIKALPPAGTTSAGNHDGEQLIMELLYVTTTLFLHALLEYTSNLTKDNSAGSTVGLTLVEAFIASPVPSNSSRSSSVCSDDLDVLSPPRPKRHRTSQDADALVPVISVGQGDGVCGTSLPLALSTGIKCWDLLHSHSKLGSEFNSLLERLCLGPALRIFTIDMLLHDARHSELLNELKCMKPQYQHHNSPKDVQTGLPFSLLELCLKLASVNFTLNTYSSAAVEALEVVTLLPPPSSTAPPPTVHPSTTPASTTVANTGLTIAAGVERHLHLLPLSRAHCLQFVVTLLINALRTRIMTHKFHDDLCIGHLLVLIQYDWPKHEGIFSEIVNVLNKQGGLCYEQFMLYITVPDIIEEFLFLDGREGGSLNLDIVKPSPHVKQQRALSTRMADRGSKHDFKDAMRKQILRCEESVPQNIINFLINEGHSIRQSLV